MNSINSSELALNQLTPGELQSVVGGWCNISCQNIRHLMTDRGDTPGQQENWIASLSPSQKP